MKIFIDTNVIISAILNPNGTPCAAYLKATTNGNQGVICEQNVDELRRIFQKKFPHKLFALEKFLYNTKLEIVPVPEATIVSEKNIRDVADRPILRAALFAEAEILLTGDKDFLEATLFKPKIMNAATFLQMIL